jgi:hypothetical protein
LTVPDLCCPECSSDQTQRVDLIYQGGTSLGGSSTRGVGVAIGEGLSITPVFGKANTKHTQQTNLAGRFPPPVPRPNPWDDKVRSAAILLTLLTVLVLMLIANYSDYLSPVAVLFLMAITMGGGMLAFAGVKKSIEPRWRMVDRESRESYDTALFWWKNTYFCHRCGHQFSLPGVRPPEPDEPDESPGRTALTGTRAARPPRKGAGRPRNRREPPPGFLDNLE